MSVKEKIDKKMHEANIENVGLSKRLGMSLSDFEAAKEDYRLFTVSQLLILIDILKISDPFNFFWG